MGQEISISQPVSDPDDPYVYSPLVGYTSFWTIEVLPGHKAEPLRCHLSPSSTAYEALSYIWGDLALRYSMFIREKELRITANLHSAMVRLCDEKEPRTLWANAVCINHKDANQKPSQIQLMPQIYQKSQRVLVYLGEAVDNS
jgi:Heterokaryon incompatibility protein (HET)